MIMMNVDKQYVFQQKKFWLMTPETYWYPRPGVAYSDKNSDWQQSYFSDFNLVIKPLPGMVPVSQGVRTEEEEGVFRFTTDCPMQAISLVIGRYVEKSVMADSLLFSIWHIEGYDYVGNELDSIQDTIPGLIRDARNSMEWSAKLKYPFQRFSVVEVPAQFSSYVRAWTQAQEVMQPEMVFFPKKGWKFDQLDVKRRWKRHIKWSQWGNNDIDEREAKIRTFREFAFLFLQRESNSWAASQRRGQMEISQSVNPYYIYPQFYNFRYNVFSAKWPVANRLIEVYLQDKVSAVSWEREINGLSGNEKASLLFENYSFKELLGDIRYKDLLDPVIGLKASDLFAEAERKMGVALFRDSVFAVLARNTFHNIEFEQLLDTLEVISGADIKPGISSWSYPTALPFYTVSQPVVSQVNDRGKETFVLKTVISNNSDYKGVVQVNVHMGGVCGARRWLTG